VSKRAFRTALIVVFVSLAVLGTAAAFVVREIMRYPDRPHVGSGRVVTVKVAKGTRFPALAEELADDGLVDRPTWFRIYAMHKGLANKVRAGTYELRDDLSPRQLLDLLVKGVEEIDVAVTLPEGKNLREVAQLIEAAGIAPAVELEALARDPAWLKSQGIDGETADGYLFPDTYRFKKPTPARNVLETLVKQHRTVFAELRAKHQKSVDDLCGNAKLGWGAACEHDLVIMASLVEKETGSAGERPRVASVFYNRMTLSSFGSHRLETDPTIRYGCTIPAHKSEPCKAWDPSGPLHKLQLDDADNPYNTYQHAGLPPGPIANPGRASLEAAMAPEQTEYLYFVAIDEKTHFSKTFGEHDRWVQKLREHEHKAP
jgi:UPF0755 protein